MTTDDLEIPALINKQWLNEWNKVQFDQTIRKKPQPHFYLFSIRQILLKDYLKFILVQLIKAGKMIREFRGVMILRDRLT